MPWGEIETLDRGDGVAIAFERLAGAGPTFVWLGGFRSDMAGTKAQHLAEWANARGQAFVRFDYAGHGRSGGAFEAQHIGFWLQDTLAIIDRVTEGPLVLVGSSMGGWLALLAQAARPARTAGLLLIAPAWDFTETLLWPRLTPAQRTAILTEGRWEEPSAYGGAMIYTRGLFDAGTQHRIAQRIAFPGRVRILQGGRDPDVPAAHAEALAARIDSPDLEYHLIPDGDHRLSRPEDLAALTRFAGELTKA